MPTKGKGRRFLHACSKDWKSFLKATALMTSERPAQGQLQDTVARQGQRTGGRKTKATRKDSDNVEERHMGEGQ